MYKIDDEFRPRGRVFMKATQEVPSKNVVEVPIRKSSLKKGPAITTNLDDRNIQFEHEVTHEKTIEAHITEYPSYDPSSGYSSNKAITSGSNGNTKQITHYKVENGYDMPDNVTSLKAVTRNKRSSTEVLGSSFESKKLSQRAPDGHRRITTQIVRKVTTLSRAEENAEAQNLIQSAHNRSVEYGYMTTQAIEPKKVFYYIQNIRFAEVFITFVGFLVLFKSLTFHHWFY